MSDNLLDLDFDALNAETEAPEPADTARKPHAAAPQIPETGPADEIPSPEDQTQPSGSRSRRRLWEVASISGGVFLVVGLLTWFLMAFVFVEEKEEENTLELPRNRTESVMMELPLGNFRHEGGVSKEEGGPSQSVFIVEVEASIIVQGTSREIVGAEALLKSHKYRIEEVIDETLRVASDANLADPAALVIRTRIRDRINAFFSRPLVKEVVFSHYRAFQTPIKS